jgi:hypothetical protein
VKITRLLGWAAALAVTAIPVAPAVEARIAKDPYAALLALSSDITQNIGTADTIVLVYAEYDGSGVLGRDGKIMVRYAVPGTKTIRVPDDMLPLAPKLFKASFAAAGHRGGKWVAMVIDHGRAEARSGKIGDLPGATYDERLKAETEGTFPGYELAPFTPAAAKPLD